MRRVRGASSCSASVQRPLLDRKSVPSSPPIERDHPTHRVCSCQQPGSPPGTATTTATRRTARSAGRRCAGPRPSRTADTGRAGFPLGQWIAGKRRFNARGDMDADRVRQLEKAGIPEHRRGLPPRHRAPHRLWIGNEKARRDKRDSHQLHALAELGWSGRPARSEPRTSQTVAVLPQLTVGLGSPARRSPLAVEWCGNHGASSPTARRASCLGRTVCLSSHTSTPLSRLG